MMATAHDEQQAAPAALAAELRASLGLLMRRLREQGGFDDFTPSQVAALARLEREGRGITLLRRGAKA